MRFSGSTVVRRRVPGGESLTFTDTRECPPPPTRRARVTEGGGREVRDEANAYGQAIRPVSGYAAHGIQYLPAARAWPAGSRLVQWIRLDDAAARQGFAVIVKADGRFTRAAAWGGVTLAPLRGLAGTLWFLRTFYRHAIGFLGWDLKGLPATLVYVPRKAVQIGSSPPAGVWTRLEILLDAIGAEGKLVDGVGFLHPAGRIEWGRTSIVTPGGDELEVWGESIALPPDRLARTKISVQGLRAGRRIRVLFEDRELTAAEGYFVDDFRGRDLYQRFGGGPTLGYGDAPVACHVYEVP